METSIHQGIEGYLAEYLPEREERITTPMNSECEVCVIIPAYDERDYILLVLASLIRQNNVVPNQFEVLIVVNNPPLPQKSINQNYESYQKKKKRYQQVVKNNQETLKLIQYINGGIEKPDFRLSTKEKDIICKIKDWGLKVFAIDKSSQGKTLSESQANVGGARNRGVAEAVERFYKQRGKNGILAHTDADTLLEENYIRNLIKAFESNHQLVGLVGIDEDILLNPRDSEMMKEYLKVDMVGKYGMLLHTLFMMDKTEAAVYFIGSAMATRAFETAIIGGIPVLSGGEDYALGKKMESVGLTIMDSNVVTFPIIRLSPRTTTGKGQLMLEYGNKENAMTAVRCVEAAYYLGGIYKKLKEARINQQISYQDLYKIMVINSDPILTDKDLNCLFHNLHQLHSYRPEFLNKELKEIIEKICNKIDDLYKPKPITEACEELIYTYCLNDKIKKKFQEIREKMFQERKNDKIIFAKVLDKIFQEKETNRENLVTEEQIISILENYSTTLLKKKYRQKIIARFIATSQSKEEALNLININFMKELLIPGQYPVISYCFELQALKKTLEEEIQ
jgi:GT2 family glycosyltransferase